MCGFIVDKVIAEMLNKMTVVVCKSHSDESAKELQKNIDSIKANHPRSALPIYTYHALANAAPRAERYYSND